MKIQDLRLPICSIVHIIVIKLCFFPLFLKMNVIMGNNKRAPKVSKKTGSFNLWAWDHNIKHIFQQSMEKKVIK